MKILCPRIIACFILMVLVFLTACTKSLPTHPDELSYPPLDFNLPAAETLVLNNGIRLFFKEDKELPLVQITALVGAGSITTPKSKSGFGGLFGSAWRTGGAGDRTPEELDQFLDLIAANLNASMGPYTSELNLSLRSEDLEHGLNILSDLLQRPLFDPDRLELSRLQAQEQVRRQNDNPSAITRRLLMAALYPDNYLGYSPTLETLAAVTRQDLIDFHQTYFAPNKLWLAISGDFDSAHLKSLLEETFGEWEQRQVPEQELPSVIKRSSGSIVVVDKDLPQTTIAIGDLGLTKDHPDQYAVRVLNYILGGGGFNSRMMREIRSNRGLAYSAYSYFQIGRKLPGPFVAGTETKNESVVPVIALIREIMSELKKAPVEENELNLAKESQINSFIFGFENTHSVVNRQMTLTFFGYPDDYLQTYRDNIAAVNSDDVLRVAREFIDLKRQQIILVGGSDGFYNELEPLGMEFKLVDVNE